MDWKYSRYRKKHQRAVNKVFRDVNNTIRNDELWRGRFVVEPIMSNFVTCYENGYGELFIHYQFRDKKTGRTKYYADYSNHICMYDGCHIFYQMNNFIVKDCYDDTWADIEKNVKMDNTDYLSIK